MKEIVVSEHPTHYGVCSACPTSELTDDQKKQIEKCWDRVIERGSK
jgi:hypothetical protein